MIKHKVSQQQIYTRLAHKTSIPWSLDKMDKAYGVLDKAYSEVANRRGALINFSKFFRLPELIRTLRLLIVMRRNIDQDVFTPELLYFQFCLSKTPILHLFEAFLPDIIHLLALSVIVLL